MATRCAAPRRPPLPRGAAGTPRGLTPHRRRAQPKAPSYPSKAPSYPKAPSPGKGKGKFGKISLIVNDLMPHVRYRFSVKTKTLCSQHPLVFKVSHPSNSAIATTCYPYESHKCVSCSCKAHEHCEHC